MYGSALQDPGSWRDTTLNIRTAIDPARVAAALRREIAEVVADLPIFNVTTLERMFDDAVVTERTLALLSGFFGVLALLFGVDWTVWSPCVFGREATGEIGVRLALGGSTGRRARHGIARDSGVGLWLA